MDGVDRRSGFYYARELHELADILFHEAVRPALAAQMWGYDLSLSQLRGIVSINSRLCGFLAGIFVFGSCRFLAESGLRAVCIGSVLGAGTVAFWMKTSEKLNAYIATLVFPRQMVFLVALAIPLAGVLFWLSRCAREKVGRLDR